MAEETGAELRLREAGEDLDRMLSISDEEWDALEIPGSLVDQRAFKMGTFLHLRREAGETTTADLAELLRHTRDLAAEQGASEGMLELLSLNIDSVCRDLMAERASDTASDEALPEGVRRLAAWFVVERKEEKERGRAATMAVMEALRQPRHDRFFREMSAELNSPTRVLITASHGTTRESGSSRRARKASSSGSSDGSGRDSEPPLHPEADAPDDPSDGAA